MIVLLRRDDRISYNASAVLYERVQGHRRARVPRYVS